MGTISVTSSGISGNLKASPYSNPNSFQTDDGSVIESCTVTSGTLIERVSLDLELLCEAHPIDENGYVITQIVSQITLTYPFDYSNLYRNF